VLQQMGLLHISALMTAAHTGCIKRVSHSMLLLPSSPTAVAATAATFDAAGGEDAAIEVVLKGSNDSWVVCRHMGSGRQLTAVVDNEKEGLTGVMKKVQGFCDRECPGVFEGLS
jgi:hypothetical protein